MLHSYAASSDMVHINILCIMSSCEVWYCIVCMHNNTMLTLLVCWRYVVLVVFLSISSDYVCENLCVS